MPDIAISGPVGDAEAAAIVAAIRRFRDDHAPVTVVPPAVESPWLRAARLEGAGYPADAPSPWGESEHRRR